MSEPRRPLDWFQRHDAQVHELAWLRTPEQALRAASAVATEETHASPDEREEVAAPAPSPDREALEAAETKLAAATAALEQLRGELAAASAVAAEVRGELEVARAETSRLVTRMRDDAEIELVKLAMSVAERVVGRELSVSPELIVAWAREAVAGSDLGGSFVIATSADLSAAVPDAAWGELEASLRMDPALPEGSCELRDGGRSVAVSAEERLEIVGEDLAKITRTRAA